jgi:hypothetical protein
MMKKIISLLTIIMVIYSTNSALAAGWEVKSMYNARTGVLKVTVSPETGKKWNDLKIPCDKDDTVGNFTVNTLKWAIKEKEQIGKKHYVVLVYNNYDGSIGEGTIQITGPKNRGGTGAYFIVTLDGEPVYAAKTDQDGNPLPGFTSRVGGTMQILVDNTDNSGPSILPYATLTGVIAAVAVAIVIGTRYTRQRRSQ